MASDPTMDLVVDNDHFGEHDSTLGDDDDAASDTTTIKSWVRESRIENGRRYHSYGESVYWGPNDEMAQAHIDLAHELFLKTFDDALYLAPLTSPKRVLDIGTGTGIWAIDFADQFPQAQVIGTDISPIQPEWTPPNCQFELDDANREWTFTEQSFDYIHVRVLYGGIADWPELYRQCMRCLKPGGILEHAEYASEMTSEDGSLKEGTPLYQAGKLGLECFAKLNRPNGELNIYQTMRRRIKDAGFEEISYHEFKWPLGTWPKDPRLKSIGVWARALLAAGLEDYTMRSLTAFMGWSPDQVQALCAEIRVQMKDKKVHAIWPMNVMVARKP